MAAALPGLTQALAPMKTLLPFVTLFAAVIAMPASGQARRQLGPIPNVERVSIIALIANPEKYDGKAVRVEGAIQLDFEADAICLHQEDLVRGISSNCLWVEPDLKALNSDLATIQKYSHKYVLIEGVFKKDELGHRGAYSGAIVDCWRIQIQAPAIGG